MFCPKCGANNAENSRFCASCGADMTASAQPQQPQYQQPQYQQPQYQQPQYQQPPYQQPPYQQPPQQPSGGYRANIQNRSLATCIILSIVTCGIYSIIWFISMANDLNVASGNPGDTSGGMAYLLGIITCGIYLWFWLYKAGEKVDTIHSYNGQPKSNSGILYIALAFFGLSIVAYCLIQNELNKVAAM